MIAPRRGVSCRRGAGQGGDAGAVSGVGSCRITPSSGSQSSSHAARSSDRSIPASDKAFLIAAMNRLCVRTLPDLRRVRPPTQLNVYARSRQRPSECLRRRIVLDALHVQQRLHDQVAGGGNIVAVADADLAFRPPPRKRSPHGHGPGIDVAVRHHDKLEPAPNPKARTRRSFRPPPGSSTTSAER